MAPLHLRTSAFLCTLALPLFFAPAWAQTTPRITAEAGNVEASVGLKDKRKDFVLEAERRDVLAPEQGSLLPEGEAPLDTAPVERLITPGTSAEPPKPTSRPKPTAPRTAQGADAPPAHAVSAAANPLPVAAPQHLTAPLGTPAFDAAVFASPQGRTIVPESWIWERGGWSWSEGERAARLNDPLLLQAAGATPSGWTVRGTVAGPAGWLPEGPLACEASQRIELALKVHRLAMTPDELEEWNAATDTACLRSYVLD